MRGLLVKVFGGHISCGGHWVSKPQWVLPYSLFLCGGECNVHSLRSTSGATHADLLKASSTAGHFPTCIGRCGTWLRFEWAITQTEDECATIVPATQLAGPLFALVANQSLRTRRGLRGD